MKHLCFTDFHNILFLRVLYDIPVYAYIRNIRFYQGCHWCIDIIKECQEADIKSINKRGTGNAKTDKQESREF